MAFDFSFPPESIRGVMLSSLMSVGLLAALYFYLNRFTQRTYFSIWTAAWLFYAAFLVVSLNGEEIGRLGWTLKHWSLGTAAALFLWGSFRFLEQPTPRRVLLLFLGFLFAWSAAGAVYLKDSLAAELPIFGLVAMGGIATSVGFWSLRRRTMFLGAGLLAAGFLLWSGYHLVSPFTQQIPGLGAAAIFMSFVIQLFIAVSMIILALEEVRHGNEIFQRQVESVRRQQQVLEARLSETEQERQSLFTKAQQTEDLQRAYDELRETQEAILEEERLRALGQMASGIAHDINNALSPVLVYSDLLLGAERNISGPARKYLDQIKAAGSEIACIVARMKEFYRRSEDRDPALPVQLNQVVEQAITLTRPGWRDTARKNGVMIEVRTDLDTSIPFIQGVQCELREAVTNLVMNAIDALQNGGVLTLRTRRIGPASGHLDCPPQVAIEVCDTGVGMDEVTRKRCLEPFFSTKGRRGTGLGLPMVFGVAERHGGRIEIESEPGRGTLVRLVFPVDMEAPEVIRNVDGVAPPNKCLNVLYIDDEPILRELLKEALECDGHRVETAEGGAAGIRAFRSRCRAGDSFDVVITDLGMSFVDGRQVARDIKRDSPATPVLMLTGWGSFMKQEGDIPADVDGVISKPPRVDDLRFALQAVRRPGIARRKLMVGF